MSRQCANNGDINSGVEIRKRGRLTDVIAKDRFIIFESSFAKCTIIIVVVIERPAEQILWLSEALKIGFPVPNLRISYQTMQMMEAFNVRWITSTVLFRYLHLVRKEARPSGLVEGDNYNSICSRSINVNGHGKILMGELTVYA
jgi:hypothetical protein